MHTTTFDTYEAVKQLVSTGFKEDQAEMLVRQMTRVNVSDESHLATKNDLDMTKAALTTNLAELRAELLKWMFGGFATIVVLLVGILVKLSSA